MGSHCGPADKQPRAQGHVGGQHASAVPLGGSAGLRSPWLPRGPPLSRTFSRTPHLHSLRVGLGLSLQWPLILTLREAGDDPAVCTFSVQTSTTLLHSKDKSSHRRVPRVSHRLLCDFSALPSSFSRESAQMGCSRSSCPVITLVLLALLDRFSQYNPALGPVPMQTTSDYFPLLLGCTSSQHKRTFFLILLLCQELTRRVRADLFFAKIPLAKGLTELVATAGSTSCPCCS